MSQDQQPVAPDMKKLIVRAREISADLEPTELAALGPEQLRAFRERAGAGPSSARMIVLAEDTAVELGPPKRASMNAVLWTNEPGLVNDGRVLLIGPDLAEVQGQERDYAQIMMLELEPGADADLFKLESIQYLSRRLPGVMARMMPGRLWLRVSKQAMKEGLCFPLLSGAFRESYQEQVPGVCKVESLFVTRDRSSVERFSALASEAKILSGQHKKIMLAADGEYECEDLDCGTCDDKEVCDEIREVVTIRRKKRRQDQESRKEGDG